MKITVDELHEATAKYVRLASQSAIEVVESGRLLAVLQPALQTHGSTGHGTFMEREARIHRMPLISLDSTAVVSADRDAR